MFILRSTSINLSIINQAQIAILFISYLRIGLIDFDRTSSDLVAMSLLYRMVQSASCFVERKSKKLIWKENEIWWQDLSKFGWHLGPLKKLKCHFSPQKLIAILSKSSSVPLKKSSATLNSHALDTQFLSVTLKCKNTLRRESSVNWPITINFTNTSINLSIINQAQIAILFISYLRIGRIDFDGASSDLVALYLLTDIHGVQSTS
jgi:hypothetical protein